MRNLKEFTFQEWATLLPLAHLYKQTRNDIFSYHYTRKKDQSHIDENEKIKAEIENNNQNIIISITFDKEQLTELQIKNFKKYCRGALLIIADNSPTKHGRQAIQQLCKQYNVNYYSLPYNRTSHANRSHSLALQWCLKNIVTPIQPSIFGFIDHDLIPAKPFNITEKKWSSPIYGLVWNSTINKSWQLWAGYCFFKFTKTTHSNLNFMYDFSNGLDTGGRNYTYYKTIKKHFIPYVPYKLATLSKQSEELKFQIIDNCWIHMGGAGHKQGFSDRFQDLTSFLSLLENKKWETNTHFFKTINNIIH